MKVLVLDPGGTTGWVSFRDGSLVKSGEITGSAHHRVLADLLYRELPPGGTDGPYFVIYERFEHRNNEFAMLISLEYIGIIRLYCQQHNLYEIPQGASQAKPFVDAGNKLAKTGWYIPYKYRHATDAGKHLLYWLITGQHGYSEYRDELLRKVTPPELA